MTSYDQGNKIIKTLVRVSAREMGEDIFYASYKSLLGIVLKGGLSVALGPVALALPFTDMISWFTKVGIKTAIELRNTGVASVSYSLQPIKSNLWAAETTDKYQLSDFPISLPPYLEIPKKEIFPFPSFISNIMPYELSNLSRVDPNPLYSSWFNNLSVCSECQQILPSHTIFCSLNPNKIVLPNTNYNFLWTLPQTTTFLMGKFENMWVDHNVYENGNKGMRIHYKFSIQNCKKKKCHMSVLFEFQDGAKVKDYNQRYYTTDGYVATGDDFTPKYDDTVYDDLKVFLPYSELHLSSGHHNLRFYAWLYEKKTMTSIATSDYSYFYIDL